MKTPSFWKNQTLLSIVLSPVGWLYGIIVQARIRFSRPFRVLCPVICVGNITAGGTGKTPVCMALAEMLKALGRHPFFISRGYGGKLQGVVVDLQKHGPSDVGDEPLLLAQVAPVAIHSDRSLAAQLALQNGADCLIMDDGFQNPTLYKDFSFLVFDGAYGIGNGQILPAGPLRESLQNGLKRAQAVIILGEDIQNLAQKITLPLIYGQIASLSHTPKHPKVLAFAGIGHPEKFYRSLDESGFQIMETRNFPDHHFYKDEELQTLVQDAQKKGWLLYTTSKDYVKIPTPLKKDIHVLPICVQFQNPDILKRLLEGLFK